MISTERIRELIGTRLHATSDNTVKGNAEVVITVVGTPLDEHLNPTVRELYRSIDSLLEMMRDDTLLVLRSTVYPGVTKLIYNRIKTLGRNIHLAFCPERIAEGKVLDEIVKLPQIISAFEPEAMARARHLFAGITSTVIELEPLEAELAKLFSNSWRYLNFAISNQFYILAQSYGLDFYRIYDAVKRDYPRMQSFARPGFAAGPCLWKDRSSSRPFQEAISSWAMLPCWSTSACRISLSANYVLKAFPGGKWPFSAWLSKRIPMTNERVFPTSSRSCSKWRRRRYSAPTLMCTTTLLSPSNTQ